MNIYQKVKDFLLDNAAVFMKFAIIVFVLLVTIAAYSTLQKDTDKITWNDDGSITLMEGKNLWAGVWFHKNGLRISPTAFLLIKDKELSKIPFNRVKKVVFTDGNYYDEMVIESEGNWLNDKHRFCITTRDNFETLRRHISSIASNQFVIVWNKSFMARFSKDPRKK